jgi:hypothetical protein
VESLAHEEIVARYEAMRRRTQWGAPPELFLWDTACLTLRSSEHAATNGEYEVIEGYVAMYIGADGSATFIFFDTAQVKVPNLEFAKMVVSLQLQPQLSQRMAARDILLHANGVPDGLHDGDWPRLLAIAAAMPADDGVPLPLAYIALTTDLVTGQHHLEFLCYKGLPMLLFWRAFQENLAQHIVV